MKKLISFVRMSVCTLMFAGIFAPSLSAQSVGDYVDFHGLRCRVNKKTVSGKVTRTYLTVEANTANPYEGDYEVPTYEHPSTYEYTYVDSIAPRAFRSCSKLKSVRFNGSQLKYIGDDAFSYSGIETLILPNSIRGLGKTPFNFCSKMTRFVVLVKDPSWITLYTAQATNSLQGISKSTCKLYVPQSAVAAYSDALYWHEFADNGNIVAVPMSAGDTFTHDGFTYDIYGTYADNSVGTVVTGMVDKNATVANIPESFEMFPFTYKPDVIGKNAFRDYDNLTSVTIPERVSRIYAYAFAFSENLASVNIPDNVIQLGEFAFRGTGISSIEIPAAITAIGQGMFADTPNLRSVTFKGNVTSLGNYAFEASGIISFTMPEAVTEVPEGLFSSSKIRNITLSPQTTKIGENAFSYCVNLQKISLPETLTTIEAEAFAGNSDMDITLYANPRNVTFPLNAFDLTDSTNPKGHRLHLSTSEAINYCRNTSPWKLFNVSGVDGIGTRFTLDGFNYTVIGFTDADHGLAQISGYQQYADEYKLVPEVEYEGKPYKVTTIAQSALSSMPITELIVPEGIERIENGNLYNMSKLQTLILPSTLTYLGSSYSLPALAQVIVNAADPSKIITSSAAFDAYGSVPVFVPAESFNAFKSANRWKDLNLQVSSLADDDEFSVGILKYKVLDAAACKISVAGLADGAEMPETLVIPSSLIYMGKNLTVTAIADLAFRYCTSTSVQLPATLEIIGTAAFNSSKLTAVDIPEGVKTIESSAFMYCWDLASATFPESLESIGKYAFCKTGINSVYIGANLVDFHGDAITSTGTIKTVTVSEQNSAFVCIDNVVYSKDLKTLIFYTPGKVDKEYTILDGVQTIASYAIERLVNLRRLTVPASVRKIEEYGMNTTANLAVHFLNTTCEFGRDALPSNEKKDYVFYASDPSGYTGDYTFSSIPNYSKAYIFVPKGCVDAYKASAMFSVAGDRVVENPVGKTVTNDSGFSVRFTDLTYGISTQFPGTCELIAPLSGEPYTNGVVPTSVSMGISGMEFAVTSIGEYAFFNSPVTKFNLPYFVEKICAEAFFGSQLLSINLSNCLAEIEPGAFAGCPDFARIKYNNSDVFTVDNGMILDNDGTRVVAYLNALPTQDLEVAEGVTAIAPRAFENATNLRSATFPAGIHEIGYHVFYDCANIEKVTILAPNADDVIVDAVAFGGMNPGAVLYVPREGYESYQADYITWTYYFADVLPIGVAGDLTGDGEVDSSDLATIINMITGTSASAPAADLNGDGEVDSSDLATIINMITGTR